MNSDAAMQCIVHVHVDHSSHFFLHFMTNVNFPTTQKCCLTRPVMHDHSNACAYYGTDMRYFSVEQMQGFFSQ